MNYEGPERRSGWSGSAGDAMSHTRPTPPPTTQAPYRPSVMEYAVPVSTTMWTAQLVPGFRSMDMRAVVIGQQLLDHDGYLHECAQDLGFVQRYWRVVGPVLPAGWSWQADEASFSETVEARMVQHEKVLVCRAEQLALLTQAWLDAGPGSTAAFFEDLAVQLHRPAVLRRGLMKLVKHPTRRGSVAMTNVEPMTPWAVRAASERLVLDLSDDADHQADDVNLKRYANLRARYEELQAQLDEVAGHLGAAQALLRSQTRVRVNR